MSSWGEVKNIGLPYNSPADDLHFSLLADGKSGWVTSNRIFESEKGVTTDNDIFHFSVKATILKLTLEVTDTEGKMIPGFSLKLFEDINENSLPQFSREYAYISKVSLDVLPSRDYVIRIQSPGFDMEEQQFKMAEPSDGQMKLLFRLKPEIKKELNPPVSEKRVLEIIDEVGTTNQPLPPVPATPEVYRAKGISQYDNGEYETDSPRFPGTSYKIQLEATDKVQMGKYNLLASAGKVHTEFLIEKKLFRVLIGPFSDVSEAKNVKAASVKNGFSKAFIVKYEDGIRVGMTGL
jgi:hypothetical protein